MRMRCNDWRCRGSCRMQKRPREPGTPGETKRNSPSNCCHCRRVHLFRGRNCSMRATVRWARCSGRDSVWDKELINQPKTVLTVSQEASPLLSFLRESGSLALGCWSGDLRKSSTVRSRIRRTVVRRCLEPWQRAMKLSTNTSM